LGDTTPEPPKIEAPPSLIGLRGFCFGTIAAMRNKHPTTKEVLRQVTSLEAHINKLEVIPATALYRSKVLLALLSKAFTVSSSLLKNTDSLQL
jgi:hypothetical protein